MSCERNIYPIQRLPVVIPIGIQTETDVEEVAFDVYAWSHKWPDMEVTVWHRLPGQADAYLCKSRREGDILYWEVMDTDTQTPGTGRVELMGTTATGRKLSGNTATRIKDTIAATTQDPPLAPPTWVETVQEMIRQSGGGGGGCGTPATDVEIIEALLAADAIPALMVDEALLALDNDVCII